MKLIIYLLFLIQYISINNFVNSEAIIKFNFCQTENCLKDPSRETCINKLFKESSSKYSHITVPDYPNSISILQNLYSFTHFTNDKLIQVSGGYQKTVTNYSYPIKPISNSIYNQTECDFIDITSCYMSVMCTYDPKNDKERLELALGIVFPLLALLLLVLGIFLFKKYSSKSNNQYTPLTAYGAL